MWKNFTLISALASLTFLTQTLEGIPYRVFEDDRVEISVDALFVQRKGIRRKTLVGDFSLRNSCSCLGTVMSSTQLMDRLGWEPGVKGTLCYTPSKKRSVEVSVAWVNEWHSHLHRTGNSTLYFPFRITMTQDYNTATRAKATYKSQLWDFEGNYWGHITPRGENCFSVSAIAGMRGLYLGEHARLEYTTPPDRSDYTANTKNRLFGIQGGLCFQWNIGCSHLWSWELIPKIGLLGNWISARTLLQDVNDTVTIRSTQKSKLMPAYLLDGDARLSYHPGRHFSAHIGYRAIGLWNVAEAPDMFSKSPSYHSAEHINHWRAYFQIAYLGLGWVF